MRSRDEFEALVLQKLEAKRSGAVRTRRAWESVAATAAACFLMVLTAYLVVPDGFGAPAVTVDPVTTVDAETTVPETISEEEITLRALADAALAEKYGIFDFSTFDIYGVMHDDEATFNYTFQFDGYRTDERYTVSLTYEGVILKITDEEAGLYTEGRIFDRFAKVDVERALASLAEQRRPYAHIKNHACEMTVSSNKLQLYVEIIEDIDPPETEIYDGTVFDSGCGKDHRHIMFRETVTAIGDVDSVTTEAPETTAPETTAPPLFEDEEEKLAFYSDPSMSLEALREGLVKTQCPADLLPTAVVSMNDNEMLSLIPYFQDTRVREILSLDPFYTPEQIDLGFLMYCQHEGVILTEEELEAVGVEDEDGKWFCGSKLTTAEFQDILATYLGAKLTPLMLQTLWDEPYLAAFDAYYAFHTDYNVAPLAILQGWKTEEGGYLIRFWQEDSFNGDFTVWLQPAGDRYQIKQILCLGKTPILPHGEALETLGITGLGIDCLYDGDIPALYQTYLSLPLKKKEVRDPVVSSSVLLTFGYKNGGAEEVWLTEDAICIGSVWYEPDTDTYDQLLERLGLSFEDFEEDTTEGTSCSHEYRVTAERETSCKQDGYRIYTCLLCSHNRSETIPALEHDYQWSDSLDSDCRKQGYDTYTCTVCHGSYTEDRPFASHTYADGYCTVCGEPQASEGLAYSLNADGASYTVTGMGTCTDTVVVIPARYQAYPVTRIGDRAFKDQTAITAFGLPASLREIDELAFSGCIGITEMVIPEGVTTLRYGALHCCDNLTELNLPSTLTEIEKDFYYSVSGKLLAIPVAPDNPRYVFRDGALYDNGGTVLLQYAIGRKDETFTVPQGVTAIAFGAFRNAGLLQKVILPEGVTEIGSSAFQGCASLVDISLPLSLIRIEGYAFDGCYALKTLCDGNSLKNHSALTEIGSGAFQSCKSLKTIQLPDGVTEIAEKTFAYCKALYTIELPSSVTVIGENAFSGCGLGKIKLPSSVTSVGGEAFADCPNLTLARIPKSVTTMGYKVFDGCKFLTKIYCAAPSRPTGWRSTWNSGTNAVVYWNVT